MKQENVEIDMSWRHFSRCELNLYGTTESVLVPDNLMKAVIFQMYKGKENKSDCMNYRGKSLLSIVGKCME